MWKIALLVCSGICYVHTLPAPQDFQTSALMLAGQMKDIMDNGAAVRNGKEFEFMGAKAQTNTEFGFGDAMKSGRRRRRRAIFTDELLRLRRDASDSSLSSKSSSSYSSSSSSSSFSDSTSESEEN